MNHEYKLLMDGKYMNTFYSYEKATEERDILQRRYPSAHLHIVSVN